MKRLFLELGGKSATIVLDDADLGIASFMGLAVCTHAGQGCAIPTRMLLPRRRYDEGVELIQHDDGGASPTATRRTPATCMGPQISAKQRDRVLGYIEKGVAEGATLALGGGRPAHLDKGFFVEPTLFVDVDNSMTIAQEEIFGPVLVVHPVRRRRRRRAHRQRQPLRPGRHRVLRLARAVDGGRPTASAPASSASTAAPPTAPTCPSAATSRAASAARTASPASTSTSRPSRSPGRRRDRHRAPRRRTTTRTTSRSTPTRTRSGGASATRRRSTTTSKHDFYALSRFNDVEGGLKDWKTYSSGKGSLLELIKADIEIPPGSIIFDDPPGHDVHRGILSRVFTPRKMARHRAQGPRVLRPQPRPARRLRRLRLHRRPRRPDADAHHRHAARHPRAGPGGAPRPDRRRPPHARTARSPTSRTSTPASTRPTPSPTTSTGAPSTPPTT